MGVMQSIRQRKPVTYPTLKLCEEVVGGFLAYRGRDSSPATWRVFAGGTNQAFLDKHPFDASGLHPGHCPRGVGHSEVLNSHPLWSGLHRPDECPPNNVLETQDMIRAGTVRPRLQDSESTSYCCRLCSICSVPCRSWSCLASQSCSGVTFVLTIPQKGMNSSNASRPLGESDSAINAIALSRTGNASAMIFPSDLKFLRPSCPGRTTCLIIPAYCSVGSIGPGSTKSMVTRYCIPPSSFLSHFHRWASSIPLTMTADNEGVNTLARCSAVNSHQTLI